MMKTLIGDPKLFVMQVEMDIYTVLKRVGLVFFNDFKDSLLK